MKAEWIVKADNEARYVNIESGRVLARVILVAPLDEWEATAEGEVLGRYITAGHAQRAVEDYFLPERMRLRRFKGERTPKPSRKVLLAELDELGTRAAVWRAHYPNVTRATVYNWFVSYKIDPAKDKENRADREKMEF